MIKTDSLLSGAVVVIRVIKRTALGLAPSSALPVAPAPGGRTTPLLGRLLGLGRRVLLLGHLAHGLLGLARAREPIDLRLQLRERVDQLGVALDGHVEQPVDLVVLVAELLALLGVARARVLELEQLLAQLALRLLRVRVRVRLGLGLGLGLG